MTKMTADLRTLVRAAREAGRTNESIVDWRDAARKFGFRLRLVRLRKRRWWVLDNGPLLAFRREDGAPVVLTLTGRKGYRVFDPCSGTESVCNDDMAASLKEEAFMPYQTTTPLPGGASEFSLGVDPDALRQVRYGLLAAGIACCLLLAPLVIHRLVSTFDPARHLAGAFVWMGLAAAFAMAELIGAVAGLRCRLKENLLLHASTWNRVLGLPLERFRVAPAAEFAAKIDAGIAAGDEATAQRYMLRFEVSELFAAIVLLVAALPALSGPVCLTLSALAATQFATTLAYQASLSRETTQAPKILQTRSLLAWYLPALRSLGALGWAVKLGLAATGEEVTSRLRTEALRQRAEILRRWGPPLPAFAIAVAIAGGWQEDVTAGHLCVAFASLLWAGSAACKVASGLATVRTANLRLAEVDSFLGQPAAGHAGRACSLGCINTVAFESVSFAYPRAPDPSLVDISFQLRSGECLAIAGPSGSGKTTLVRLLTGLEHPTRGLVRVNGIDLRSADTGDYRRRVGAVFQDETIEVATIRRMILGMAPIPEERAWEAARLARIADMITNLPMGMQTMVAPLTVPSAVQHQLLIARALARRPEMLVLDEALSNLDSDAQSGLVSDLRHSGITVVICTHRPSTMALADRIIRLERGGVVV